VAAKGARVRMSQNTMESAKQFYPATESTLTAEQVHDRQWELNKYNFRAQWECDMTWYSRSTDATTTNQALRVADASSMAMCGCTMHLLPTAGSTDTRCASLPRICGNCIQFPGLGGQSAIVMNPTAEEIPPKCGHEINFFAQPESKFKSRSMIVALWALDKSGKAPVLRLSTVGIAPFRDGLAESSGVREDRVRSVGSPGSALDMLGAFKGWTGKREVYKREVQPSGNPAPTQTDVAFDLKTYENARACLRFPDNLIFAGPRSITGDGPFTLVFACQTASDVFKQLSIAYDASGVLDTWTLDVLRPSS